MNWKVLLGLIVSYVIYLLIGAAVFEAIERPAEEQQCAEAIAQVADIRSKLVETAANITFDDVSRLAQLLQSISSFGVQVDENFNVTCVSNWDFQSSFFFSGTVLTTIGYGHISPTTDLGRSICIIYALIGLPLFGIMFSGLGELFASGIKKLDKRIMGKAKRSWVGKIILLLVVVLAFLTFFMLIPAAIFMAVERWTYQESFYYSFITLTTIGFGDFVVGTNPEIDYISIYRVLVYFWIVFGIAFMATVISLIGDLWKKTGENARSRVGVDDVDGEEGEGEDGKKENNQSQQDGEQVENEMYEENGKPAEKDVSSSSETLETRPLNAHSGVAENGHGATEVQVQNT